MAVVVQEAADSDVIVEPLDDEGLTQMIRIGRLMINVNGRTCQLSVFWILGYGGGLFLPLRDANNRSETYGGGRYLMDAVKGADLGREEDRLILDFKYAYNPSCAYNSQWHFLLPSAENRLDLPIRAGELRFPSGSDGPIS